MHLVYFYEVPVNIEIYLYYFLIIVNSEYIHL